MSLDLRRVATTLRRAGIDRVELDVPLGPMTTLRVGGPADVGVVVEDEQQLILVARACGAHGLPWLVIGRGSNLLVPDAGFAGVAIRLGRGFRQVTIDDRLVVAGAAQPLPVLAQQVAAAGLRGFAWAAAVPGSIGGAVRMNAGAHGGQMADHLRWVDVVDMTSAAAQRVGASDLSFGYRTTSLPASMVVVRASLELDTGDAAAVRAEIEEIRAWRRAHQPLNEPNCGSVFVNPAGESAGRLIEEAGCKGLRRGGARVSEIHANFVVTTPEATAADVEALISAVRQRVHDHRGVWLDTEVVMVDATGLIDTPAGDG